MHVTPYLTFDGRCEEALEFYKKALDADVQMMMRFKESPEQQYNPPNSAEKIMHSAFKVGDTLIMATDGDCAGTSSFSGISLAITAPSTDTAEKYFAALQEGGGTAQMPMIETFFAERFGIVADKFDVKWMVLGGSKA